MDEKIQLGPRAQVTWVKGSSGGAKASESGEGGAPGQLSHHPLGEKNSLTSLLPLTSTELSRTAGLNRYSALQPTPSPQPAAAAAPASTQPQNPDFDSRRTLGR